MGVSELAGRSPYRAPVPIGSGHQLDDFDCGKEPLNEWLRSHALNNEGKASRTYVVADTSMQVLAYYTIALGSVIRAEVPRKHRLGMAWHDQPRPSDAARQARCRSPMQ